MTTLVQLSTLPVVPELFVLYLAVLRDYKYATRPRIHLFLNLYLYTKTINIMAPRRVPSMASVAPSRSESPAPGAGPEEDQAKSFLEVRAVLTLKSFRCHSSTQLMSFNNM
jgi:hypothetical protein